jgi:hypothetical protein
MSWDFGLLFLLRLKAATIVAEGNALGISPPSSSPCKGGPRRCVRIGLPLQGKNKNDRIPRALPSAKMGQAVGLNFGLAVYYTYIIRVGPTRHDASDSNNAKMVADNSVS